MADSFSLPLLTALSPQGSPSSTALIAASHGGFESVVIFPGETFDVSVVPLPAVRVAAGALFWVRASTLEEGYANHTARAIVRYRDGGADQSAAEDAAADDRPELGLGTYNGPDPTTHPLAGGRVPNCPFPDFGPLASGIECVAIDSLRAAAGTPPVPGGNVTEIFLNFGFEPSINNRHFVTPAAPPLTQPPGEALPTPCDDAACATSAFPRAPVARATCQGGNGWTRCSVCGSDVIWAAPIAGSDTARAWATHHCRACGGVVCAFCAPAADKMAGDSIGEFDRLPDHRMPLPTRGYLEPVRVCRPCTYKSCSM